MTDRTPPLPPDYVPPVASLHPPRVLAAEAEDLAARVAEAEDRQAQTADGPSCCRTRPDASPVHALPEPRLRHNPLAPGCEEGGSAWMHGQRCAVCAPRDLDPRLVVSLRRFADEWGPMGVALALLDLYPPLRSSLLTRLAAEARVHTPTPLPHSRACGFRPHDHGPSCSRDCPTCGGGRPAPTSSLPDPITYPRDDRADRTPGPRWCRIHGTGRCTRTCHGRKPATSDARAADPLADYR